MNLPNNASFPSNLFQQTPDGVFTYRMPAVKSNRPVNVVHGSSFRSKLKIARGLLHQFYTVFWCHRIFTRTGTFMVVRQVFVFT